MMVKPMKTLELHYPMIQFLIIIIIIIIIIINIYIAQIPCEYVQMRVTNK